MDVVTAGGFWALIIITSLTRSHSTCPWIFSVVVNSFPPQISHSFPGWPWVRKCFLLWGWPLSPCGFSQERVRCSTSWGCTRVRCFSPRQFFKWTFRTVIPSAVSHMAPSWCLQPHEYLPPNPLWHVRMSQRSRLARQPGAAGPVPRLSLGSPARRRLLWCPSR